MSLLLSLGRIQVNAAITDDFAEEVLASAMDTALWPMGTIYETLDEAAESPNTSELGRQVLEVGKGIVIGLVIGKVSRG
jgi:hypothetical protein